VQHGVVAPEDLLGAVAVMDVPVEDRDPLEPEGRLRVTGGDRGAVEDAEAHRAARERMVARRPREREASALDRLDGRAGGEESRLEGRLRRDRVHVEPRLGRDRPDTFDVLAGVTALDLLDRRGARLEWRQLG